MNAMRSVEAFPATCPDADARHAAKLRLQDVGKRFDAGGGAATIAVQDFTLDVAQGEFLVIVGPSGCGKTTVLTCSRGSSVPRQAT